MAKNLALKVLRIKHGLTQEEMAKKLLVSRGFYAKIENGQENGNISFWSKLQRTFKISSEEMWDLINDEKRTEVRNAP